MRRRARGGRKTSERPTSAKVPPFPIIFFLPHDRDKHHRFDEKIHSFSLKIDHFSDVCTVAEIFSHPRVLKSVCFKMHFSRQSVCSIRESNYICSIKSQLPSAVRKFVGGMSMPRTLLPATSSSRRLPVKSRPVRLWCTSPLTTHRQLHQRDARCH